MAKVATEEAKRERNENRTGEWIDPAKDVGKQYKTIPVKSAPVNGSEAVEIDFDVEYKKVKS